MVECTLYPLDYEWIIGGHAPDLMVECTSIIKLAGALKADTPPI